MSCRLLTSCGKGRRASLCIDADDGWVHGNRSSKEGKKKWGVGAVGRHWMSNSLTSPSTALWIFAPLSAHRMRSLLSALSALEMKRQVAKLPCVWLRDKSAYRFIRELDVSLFFQIDHEGWVGVFADLAPPQTRITTESIAHNHWVSNSQNYGSKKNFFC